MQFESKIKRSLWLGSIAGVILDVSISIVLASLFDGGTTGFVAALLGLQLLYFPPGPPPGVELVQVKSDALLKEKR